MCTDTQRTLRTQRSAFSTERSRGGEGGDLPAEGHCWEMGEWDLSCRVGCVSCPALGGLSEDLTSASPGVLGQ